MSRIYKYDDSERYIPIDLGELVTGAQIPFEIFTHDGTIYKSLLDKGSTYSYYAQRMIEDQALSKFYIRQGSALNFDEYMHNAAKLKKMLLEPDFFNSRYKAFRDKWFIVDKQVLDSGIPFTLPLGGLRFPLFGEIPFSVDSNDAYRNLLDLNSDIAVREQDVDSYYLYLDKILDAEGIEDPLLKLRCRREKLKVWCYRLLEEARNNSITQDTLFKLYKHINIVMNLIANDFGYAGKFLFFDVSDFFLYIHSTNVCLMSLMYGHASNMEEAELLNLGISAMLHDVGRVDIDDDAGENSYNEMEREIFKSHVIKGKELLDPQRDVPKAAKIVALTHHEREDGSGYMAGLTGDRISKFSKIVALADTFESSRVTDFKHTFKKRTQIIGEMVHQEHIFEPDMLKTFIGFIAKLTI
ncbi:MAG: HD domain-containing protein [Nitrospirae bacterium]|nr:MAG: HD domain-containing protein [Nitrospirota bacterium]